MKRVKIEKIDTNKLKISLSCTEILQMNLDMHSQESKNSLIKLLNSLENEHCFSILDQKIIFEMLPSEENGCTIYLTGTATAKKESRLQKNILIFSFIRLDSIFEVSQKFKEKFNGIALVYYLDEMYYLVLYFESNDHFKWIRTVLSDFGETISNPKVFESVLQEYGKVICSHDAYAFFLTKLC